MAVLGMVRYPLVFDHYSVNGTRCVLIKLPENSQMFVLSFLFGVLVFGWFWFFFEIIRMLMGISLFLRQAQY